MPTRLIPSPAARSRGASLRTFMRLPVAQRSSVILMDVLGCSLQEVCEVMDFSLPAVKAALHRGRTRLRELADEPDDLPRPELSKADRDRLGAYVAHFNARDFDAIRAMICRRCAARSRQQDADERQGRSFQIFRKLFESRRLASGAGTGGGTSGHPGVLTPARPAQRRNISCCCNGRPTKSPPSAISATRPTLSMAPNIACEISKIFRRVAALIDPGDPRDGRNRSQITSTIILAIRTISELWCRWLRG